MRHWLLLAGAAGVLCAGGYVAFPRVVTALNTVSTDDAYVNGHVTFVAPRVIGQVQRVLVDDNGGYAVLHTGSGTMGLFDEQGKLLKTVALGTEGRRRKVDWN